jgi:hypothetical protein
MHFEVFLAERREVTQPLTHALRSSGQSILLISEKPVAGASCLFRSEVCRCLSV